MERILVEPGEVQVGQDREAALALVAAIHRRRDHHGLRVDGAHDFRHHQWEPSAV